MHLWALSYPQHNRQRNRSRKINRAMIHPQRTRVAIMLLMFRNSRMPRANGEVIMFTKFGSNKCCVKDEAAKSISAHFVLVRGRDACGRRGRSAGQYIIYVSTRVDAPSRRPTS